MEPSGGKGRRPYSSARRTNNAAVGQAQSLPALARWARLPHNRDPSVATTASVALADVGQCSQGHACGKARSHTNALFAASSLTLAFTSSGHAGRAAAGTSHWDQSASM
jgi:hypothetical protein